MHGKFWLLSPRGKRAAIVRLYPDLFNLLSLFCSCPVCCVFIPLDVRPALLRQMDMESLTWAQISVHAVLIRRGERGGVGVVRHKQVCTRVDLEDGRRSSNANPKTLGSIPWRGRVSTSFSIPPSQLLCRLVCA